MDDLDRRLVAALRRDGRASLSDLAARLGVTRATVRTRLATLETSGEVLGYTVVTRAEAEDAPVRAVMTVGIEGSGTRRVIARLTGMTEVAAVHSTAGRWDLVVELAADDLARLDAALHAIRRIEGITTSETSLLLATHHRAGR